jgi:hypothetical protein
VNFFEPVTCAPDLEPGVCEECGYATENPYAAICDTCGQPEVITVADIFIAREFPSCVHVSVRAPKSERSAVALARNLATKHYGQSVGHYASSGGSYSAGVETLTYVFSNPVPKKDYANASIAERMRDCACGLRESWSVNCPVHGDD